MNNNVHGIDHIGLTVPNLEEATIFLVNALNATVLYDTYKKLEPIRDGDFTQKRLGISHNMAERAIRMIGLPNGAQIELFEFKAPTKKNLLPPLILVGSMLHFMLMILKKLLHKLRMPVVKGTLIQLI